MATDLRYSGNVLSLLIFFIVFNFHVNSLAQDSPDGYVSIDCGSDAHSTDDTTKLPWVEDGDYATPGSNAYIQNISMLVQGSDNYQALQTFRYFSEESMKSKYCYGLPLTTNNISFLVRAMFLHGNASELQLPIQFDVYVNASFWMEINFNDSDNLYLPRAIESIFFSPLGGNTTYICLVPKQGVPFISSLELRQFDPEGLMYTKSFVNSKELFFTTSVRHNLAGTTPTVRYPDDIYDRLWKQFFLNVEVLEVPKTWSDIGPELNSVPSKVMESALAYFSRATLIYKFDLPTTKLGSLTFAIFYFAGNDSDLHEQQIDLDATAFPSFTITNQPSQQSYFHVLNENFTSLAITGPFVLNAMEVFKVDPIIQQTTDTKHVKVMDFIKETLNMTSWSGDPCTPVPYDWIGCYLEYKGFSWLVDTLTLSHLKSATGLSSLSYTDWQGENNQTVNYMSITNSNVDSSLFSSLLQNFVQPSWLISLNMSFNNINVFPDSEWWSNALFNNSFVAKNLTSLDLSYNKLTRIPCFNEIPYFNYLQVLNLSNNMIGGQFPDTKCFSNLTNLKVLILSNNYLQGEIPSSLSIQNLPRLQVLDISNNKFFGDFPSEFYFTNEVNTFQSLNVDNNDISGVLNLNQWYQNLKATSDNVIDLQDFLKSTNNNIYHQKFSFLKNKIDNLVPAIEEFQPLIGNLSHDHGNDFNQSGILLGGNPYCGHGERFTQRYLCRSSSSEIVYADQEKKSKKAIILGGIFGGGFLVVCFLFFSVVIWRLSNKVYILKMVEQELANRSVQPPYYSFADLKAATKNFHKSNHLGKGNFGEVYKGVLSDGSTIAIKRLFNANKKQVLNDFLNEVVLITGIKHKNLIQLKGCCIENEERILVYGFAENGNVEDALRGEAHDTILNWKSRYDICVGIANGLTYLHEELQPKIIHRDIKPANILLDKNLNPKVADFGLAKSFLEDVDEHVTQMICGTIGYFAPEYFAQGRLTTKVDVFSFGVVALEIVSGRKCYDPHLSPEESQLIPRALHLQRSGSALDLMDPILRYTEYSEPQVLKLINIALMCVESDPELRPAMSKIETMLMEGEDRMYDNLCSAFMRRGESNSSIDKLLKQIMRENRVDSSTSTSRSQSSSRLSSSFGALSIVSEELPLL